MTTSKILLADDDRDLVDMLRYTLQRDGHKVVMAFDGEEALRAFELEQPDLLILDFMMPRKNGLQVLHDVRQKSSAPVLLLTAADDEETLVNAFRTGADDYLMKPFRPRELKMRVFALLRRGQLSAQAAPRIDRAMEYGGLSLNPSNREVRLQGNPVHLTRTEFDLLAYLMRHPNTVIAVPDLITNIWGYENESGGDIVKVTVSRLRRKIEPDPQQPRYITTVHGAGYMFQPLP